jgi:hypothetical protein
MVNAREHKVDMAAQEYVVEGHLGAIYGSSRECVNLHIVATLHTSQKQRLSDGDSLAHATLHTLGGYGYDVAELSCEVYHSAESL